MREQRNKINENYLKFWPLLHSWLKEVWRRRCNKNVLIFYNPFKFHLYTQIAAAFKRWSKTKSCSLGNIWESLFSISFLHTNWKFESECSSVQNKCELIKCVIRCFKYHNSIEKKSSNSRRNMRRKSARFLKKTFL